MSYRPREIGEGTEEWIYLKEIKYFRRKRWGGGGRIGFGQYGYLSEKREKKGAQHPLKED